MSDQSYIIGDQWADRNSVTAAGAAVVINLNWTPQNVQATDGTFPTKTQITWEYEDGYKAAVSGFKVFRETTEVCDIDIGQAYTCNDPDGLKGKSYVYKVIAYNDSGAESLPNSDEGFQAADGVISGTVATLVGNSPVPGVTVMATGEVEGQFYTYEATTNSLGGFNMPEVYYGEDPAGVIYTLTPSLNNHVFQPASDDVSLSPTSKNAAFNFSDKTAYIVKGIVKHDNMDCGIEGIYVRALSDIGGPEPFMNEALTDKDGAYTLVVEPDRTGLEEILIQVDPFKLVENDLGISDTVFYDNFISGDQVSFTDFVAFKEELIREVNFKEETTYPVFLKVQNACQDPLSNDLFDIRVRSLDGCFDQVFPTDNNGEVTAPLPPLDLLMTVVSVNNPTPANLNAINFFASHPVKLNLLDIHQQYYPDLTPVQKEDLSNGIMTLELDTLTKRPFTFHKAPSFVVNGFEKFFCGEPSNAAILTQGDNYTLNILISENHGGQNCPVKEGRLKITNAAEEDSQPKFIDYDPDLPGFPAYNFKAGNPNVISPHFYSINIDYLSTNGDFLGSFIKPVFVEGDIAVPGTDIIVDPRRNNQVQFPLFVLRDPPGDGSYSYIAKGETISESVSVTSENNHTNSAFANGSTEIIGIGTTLNVSGGDTRTDSETVNWSYEVTTNQTLSTSSSENFVGPAADIVVGMGLAMQYGIVQNFRAGECDTIYQTSYIGISPSGVNTTWSFTVQQIQDIVTGYRNDSLRVEAGTLKLK